MSKSTGEMSTLWLGHYDSGEVIQTLKRLKPEQAARLSDAMTINGDPIKIEELGEDTQEFLCEEYLLPGSAPDFDSKVILLSTLANVK